MALAKPEHGLGVDMLVSDIVMPHVSGSTLVHEIRKTTSA